MIGFIGIGNMGSAVLNGYLRLLENDGDNLSSPTYKEAIIYNRSVAKVEGYRKHKSIVIANSLAEVLSQADIIFLGIKPQGYLDFFKTVRQVKTENSDNFNIQHTWVSLAAGIKIEKIDQMLGSAMPNKIIRAMPNTPMLVGAGFTGISKNDHIHSEVYSFVKDVFSARGDVVDVDEDLINALAAVSGSGPAYVFLWLDYMAKAGVKLGLSEDVSKRAAVATVYGAAKMAGASELSLEELCQNVCSPRGTTIEAIDYFKDSNLDDIFYEAMRRTVEKSEKLAEL